MENVDYEARILDWFNVHKNDTTYVKACALYNHTPLGHTGLHHILDQRYSFVSVIEIWLKYAPEAAQVKDAWGCLPLHIACCHRSSLEVVMVLIEAYPKGVEEGDMNKLLPLHLSCCNGGGHLEVVKALIDAYPKGAEEGDVNNTLPLHCACSCAMQPSVEVLSVLLQANPKRIDGEGNLRIASFHLKNMPIRDSDEDEDLLETEEEEFVDNELISRLIHEATKGGHFLVVKLFVTAFPQSVTMQDEDGMLPLHHACSNIKYVYIAMVLLDANPESAFVTDNLGRTSLQLLMPLAKVEDRKGELLQKDGMGIQAYGPDDYYLGQVEKYLTPKIIRLIVFSNCQHYIEAEEARHRGRDATSICSDEEVAVQPDVVLPPKRNTFGASVECGSLRLSRKTRSRISDERNSDNLLSSSESTVKYSKDNRFTVPLIASRSAANCSRSIKNSLEIFPILPVPTDTTYDGNVLNYSAKTLPEKKTAKPAMTTFDDTANGNIQLGDSATYAMFSMMQQFLKSQYAKDILSEAINNITGDSQSNNTTKQPCLQGSDIDIVDTGAKGVEFQQ